MSNHTGWNKHLIVRLTATSNPYLAPKLPLRGLIQVHEMALDGYAQRTKVTFLQVDEAGNPVGTEVSVDDAEFSYAPRSTGEVGSRARS